MQNSKVRKFWDTLPHCCGYPKCDGDLEGIEHSEDCPLFGKEEIGMFEFAELYAAKCITDIDEESDLPEQELCPECESILEPGPNMSGVKCPNCPYWFCF